MEYKPNSHKYKAEQAEKNKPKRDIKKIASGKKVQKKKGNKVASYLLGDDADSVRSYIVGDIVVPYIKKTLSDVVNAILFPGGGNNRNSNVSKVSYRDYYDRPGNNVRRNMNPPSSAGYDEVCLASRGEAEDVLDNLYEILSIYNQVFVNDLYDSVGLTGVPTGYNYGWDNLRGSRIVRTTDGYVIKMPPVKPL